MKPDFDQFKAHFTAFLQDCDAPPDGLFFLRYETLEAARHLPTVEKFHFSPQQALEDHLETLAQCQDFAVSKGVTSTYIFFNSDACTLWLQEQGLRDTPENRAIWAQQEVEQEVTPHVSQGIIWFSSSGVSARRFAAVLD